MTEDLPAPSDRSFLFYDTENGTTRVQLLVDGQTVWMRQIAIAELFETSKQNVGQHIKNIVEDSELSEDSVVKNYFTTAADGKTYKTKHYNLDMSLAIGYRVRSSRRGQFRRWATQSLREYLQTLAHLDELFASLQSRVWRTFKGELFGFFARTCCSGICNKKWVIFVTEWHARKHRIHHLFPH